MRKLLNRLLGRLHQPDPAAVGVAGPRTWNCRELYPVGVVVRCSDGRKFVAASPAQARTLGLTEDAAAKRSQAQELVKNWRQENPEIVECYRAQARQEYFNGLMREKAERLVQERNGRPLEFPSDILMRLAREMVERSQAPVCEGEPATVTELYTAMRAASKEPEPLKPRRGRP